MRRRSRWLQIPGWQISGTADLIAPIPLIALISTVNDAGATTRQRAGNQLRRSGEFSR